jgi:hypothetical protein
MLKFSVAVVAAVLAAAPGAAAITITYELPTAVFTTSSGTFATETFDGAGMTTGFNQSFSYSENGITLSYAGVDVMPHDQYDGLASGNYGADYFGPYGGTGAGYTLSVSAPVDYFGAYFAATDDSNMLTFYNGNTVIGSYTLQTIRAAIGGQDQDSFFANFYFTGGETYTSIKFSQTVSCCGFESDNHTVGNFSSQTGTGVVPEPATWGMMVLGFGAMGTAMRTRKRAASLA